MFAMMSLNICIGSLQPPKKTNSKIMIIKIIIGGSLTVWKMTQLRIVELNVKIMITKPKLTSHLDNFTGQFALHFVVSFFESLELFIQLPKCRIIESYTILPSVYCGVVFVASKSFFFLKKTHMTKKACNHVLQLRLSH